MEDCDIFGDLSIGISKNLRKDAEITDYAVLKGGVGYHMNGKFKGSWAESADGTAIHPEEISEEYKHYDFYDEEGSIRPSFYYSDILIKDWKSLKNRDGVVEIVDAEFPQKIANADEMEYLNFLYRNEEIITNGEVIDGDPVYVLNGKKFLRILGNHNNVGKKLSSGEEIVFNEAYWVKFEPILWLIDISKKLATSKKILLPPNAHGYYQNGEFGRELHFHNIIGQNEKLETNDYEFKMHNLDILRQEVLLRFPMFSPLLFDLKFVSNANVSTFETDGRNIFYNPNFISNSSNEEKNYILSHQLCYIAFNYMGKGIGKEPKIWKMAADAVINAFLRQDGFTLPKDAVDIPEAIAVSAEKMYEIILKKSKMNNGAYSNSTALSTKATSLEVSKSSKKGSLLSRIHILNKKAAESSQEMYSSQENERLANVVSSYVQLGEKGFFERNRLERQRAILLLQQYITNDMHKNENFRVFDGRGTEVPNPTYYDENRIIEQNVYLETENNFPSSRK